MPALSSKDLREQSRLVDTRRLQTTDDACYVDVLEPSGVIAPDLEDTARAAGEETER